MSHPDRIEDFFKTDSTSGILKDKWSGTRVLILGSVGFGAIRNELEETFPEQASLILVRMGHGYGTELGKAAKKTGKHADDEFREIVDLARVSGWGDFELVSGEPLISSAILSVSECVFCTGRRGPHVNGCDFLTGVLVGLWSEFTQREFSVVETRCRFRDHPMCVFEIKEAGSTPLR